MNYFIYFLLSVTASCAAAAVCLGALWLLAPVLLARAGAAAPAFRKEPPPAATPAGAPAAEAARPEPEEPRLCFTLRPEQLPMLADMLRKETPDNIAIVISRMQPGLRRELLSLMDKELVRLVLVSLAAVRFVNYDMLAGLKEEIEKRLDGVVGGVEESAELINQLPYAERREIARQLETADPRLACKARALITLEEDLLSLSEKDLGVLAGALPPEQMAEVFHSLPEKLRARIKGSLPAKALALAEKAAPPRAADRRVKDEHMEKFMSAALALIASGRIARPAANIKAPPPAARPAYGGSDW